jgi:hypothetical protein
MIVFIDSCLKSIAVSGALGTMAVGLIGSANADVLNARSRGDREMHQPLKELPLVEDYGDGFYWRKAEYGGMIVSNETFPKGLDATPLFKGLPDDMCQSPHWGYVLRGRVRIKTANGDFVLKTGDVYYLEPGHVPVYEEDTEVLEFSPREEYQRTIDVVNKNIAAAQTTK